MAATNTRKAILIRTGLVYAGMLCFAAAVVWQIVNLKFIKQKELTERAAKLSIKTVSIKPERGSIFDCNGMLLSTSLPIYDIRIDGKAEVLARQTADSAALNELAEKLSQLFNDKSAMQYKKILLDVKKKGNMWFLLKRNVNYMQMKAMSNFPIFKAGKYKGGFHPQEKYRRVKPFGLLAERTVGYYREGVAGVGLEGSYNEFLDGKKGAQPMLMIAPYTYMPVENENFIEAENGKDLISTIDITLQDVAENSLYRTLAENDAQSGTAILMEVATGHIKAIANLTRIVDNNNRISYVENANHAVGNRIEPGSTFKLVSMMALLELGKNKAETIVDAEGGEKQFCYGVKPMEDSHKGEHAMTLQHAFEQSSNVAIAKQMIKTFGNNPDKVYEFFKTLGLNDKVGINLKGEEAGYIKSSKDKRWSCTSLPWMSIGYELMVTPLHIITIYNAVANNGKMVRPMIVKQIMNNGRIVKRYHTEIINNKICSDETIKALKKMMEGVVIRGTAKRLKSSDYSYAGKTGTALIANNRGGYTAGGKSYSASFCGYFPAENPKYTCYVLISKPQKEKIYGAELALPVFKDIADKVYALQLNMHKDLRFAKHYANNDLPCTPKAFTQDLSRIYNHLGISHHYHQDSISTAESVWAESNIQHNAIAIQPLLHTGGTVPDVTGMGAKDAVYLLESKGYKAIVQGKGKVIKQSVMAGTKLNKGKTIVINLG